MSGRQPEHGTINAEASGRIYSPLDSHHREIRLLNLYPASVDEEKICCTLSQAKLSCSSASNVPTYEALSYVWGKPDFTECITLNDNPFFITPSLKYILTSLRYETRSRLLWVDALCINQLDIGERSKQVALMREIYSNCERDIAWLDPMIGKDHGSNDIYGDPHLQVKEEELRVAMRLMHDITQKNPQTLKTLQDQSYGDGSLGLDLTQQLSLGDLFREPALWQRLWVMQELSLAPRLTLMCKGSELSWDSLTALFKDEPYFDAFHMNMVSHMQHYLEFNDVFVPVKRIEDQRSQLRYGDEAQSRLMDVLVRFREQQSTNPKDQVYGLLGLVTENHGIQVDYAKSTRDLYKETTIALINLSGNLDILCQNPFEVRGGPSIIQETQDAPPLPSWVAQINTKGKDRLPLIFAQRDIFNAGLKYCESPCQLLGPGKDVLNLKGVILGHVGPILGERYRATRSEGTRRLYLPKSALSHPRDHLYKPKFGNKHLSTGETSVRAFWRTLVRDCTLPPRMRRLGSAEIDALDVQNQENMVKNRDHVQTYRLLLEEKNSRSAFSYDPGDDFDFGEIDDHAEVMLARSFLASQGRNNLIFAVTNNGLFILVRPHTEEGDVVVVLDGGKLPMVLRKVSAKEQHEGKENTCRLVGPAYVHGFMDGEAEIGVTEGWLQKQDILLI
ncbi:heterokaryon incompatibility protein (het-6OR allele) [Fusarium heterosporum]|uniref:Heterokaryon incompatibility protein (Het-6OR allele) n=1 Tax=Fusarium heterosporum TaxID=42747 RepID=A0A8H5TCQ8_FUSHE|nr:heterokaryon incompatibility protein (het-6OR allele) [Fusarium heterosporum]